MTAKQLAARLDGNEYGEEIYGIEEKEAESNGLVVVFGYSDDCVEFRGAINDELGCFGGAEIPLTRNGILQAPRCDGYDMTDCCPYYEKEKAKAKKIIVKWNDGDGPAWTYETDIPHYTFDVYEDGEVFCRGIVFDMIDLK